MTKLDGRVAVVTGGGSGIGRAIVERFAAEGARVAVLDLAADAAEGVVAGVKSRGGAARAQRVDVSVSADVDRAFDEVVRAWGTVDVLVNNAGIGHLSEPLQERMMTTAMDMFGGGRRRSLGITSRLDDAEWRRMIEIHLFGTFYCTRAALRLMEERNGGAIVNMASVAGLGGIPGLAHYGAAKAGIIGFTKSVAGEVGSGNIRVNAIAPGWIDTPMTADMPPALKQMMLMRTPLGRTGTPDDIASVALFLASDDASFVTGQVVSPNGGLYL